MEKSKLLILTGPQGSGNHLWAKILSRHPFVYGWKMKKYWEGHHLEPFSHWWDDPSKIEDTQTKYNFTSISCPYFIFIFPCIPKYVEFISKASKIFDVKVVVIGRDQSILKAQQERVRGMHTTPLFENEIAKLPNPYFISMELLYLYKQKYLEHLREKLEFPIDVDYKDLVDTNEKYIKGRNIFQPLDKEVKKACEES